MQPLNWDTSRVTNMDRMFYVRCSPRPSICSCALCLPCALHARRARPPPPASRPAARPAPCALLVRPSAQGAIAFNQPLSWDTSRVTNMRAMFQVRSSPRPAPPISAVAALAPARCMHAAIARRLPPPGPQPAPHRVSCLRPSAARVALQPAAELGHLPRHEHERHVYGALLPAPHTPICSCALSPARCVHAALAARRLPPPGPQPAPHRVPCLRPSAARAALQPAAELGHLPRHEHEICVWGGQAAPCALTPHLQSQPCPLHAACTTIALRSRPYTRAEGGSCVAPHAPSAPPLRLGRDPRETPCLMPTSFSSAARGQATTPSPPNTMAQTVVRDGPRIPAPEKPSPRGVCAAGAESMAAARTIARNMCVASTPTHRRGEGGKEPNEQRLQLPNTCSRVPI